MPKNYTDRVIERMAYVYHIVVSHGCVTTTWVMSTLGLNHARVYYTLRVLKLHGRIVEVVLGKTSLWCRDEETAKRTIDELLSHMRRVLCNNGTRYATPTRVASLLASDRQAFKVFSKYVSFDTTKRTKYRPVTLSFLNALLQMAFGDPMVDSDQKTVYYVTC